MIKRQFDIISMCFPFFILPTKKYTLYSYFLLAVRLINEHFNSFICKDQILHFFTQIFRSPESLTSPIFICLHFCRCASSLNNKTNFNNLKSTILILQYFGLRHLYKRIKVLKCFTNHQKGLIGGAK